MTQQPACVPPEGAEDGSWHWLQEAQEQPKAFRWRKGVKRWFWQFGAYDIGPPEPSEENDWRYIGPASPTDATDLAAARAENAKLAAEVKDAWDAMDALGNQCREKDATIAALNDRIRELEATHAAQIASANVLIEQQKAALQEIEKEAWGLTVGMFVIRRIARAALGQSARAGGE